MTTATEPNKQRKPAWRRWIHRGFLIWAAFVMLWLANSFRTRGLSTEVLESSPTVTVTDEDETLQFVPKSNEAKAGLVFICGSGVSAHAYAEMLRPIAEAGYPVFVVKLPLRFAPIESNKQAAVERAIGVAGSHPKIARWVLAGHSLGGALACRAAKADPKAFSAMVLVGTTHPKRDDLSSLTMGVTKVYASNDGVAPRDKVLANQRLLAKDTRMVEIEGGNHSQFGHYGHQLLDGTATISRETQQTATREVILDALEKASQ